MRAPLELFAVGDMVLDDVIAPHLEGSDPELLTAMRAADVTIGNLETTVADLTTFGGWPEAEPGGSWLLTAPSSAADLSALGVDMVSLANNHATDWGVAGLRSTTSHLDAAGVVHAGAGISLAQAKAPAYVTTPRGRVALVSAATRYQVASRATDPFGVVPARPGIHGIRSRRVERVGGDDLATLRRIRDSFPVHAHRHGVLRRDAAESTVTIGTTTFDLAEDGITGPAWALDPKDVDQLMLSVRQAHQSADVVVLALHTHEPGNLSEAPPDFLPGLARRAVDAGADVVLGHGPHQLRGVEVYDGRPILYSLGNFVFMQNRQWPLTAEAWAKVGADPARTTPAEMLEMKRLAGPFEDSRWYDSVAVRVVLDGDRRPAASVVPITLGHDAEEPWRRGIPRRATGPHALRILEHLRELSHPFGADVEVHPDHTGHVRAAGAHPATSRTIS